MLAAFRKALPTLLRLTQAAAFLLLLSPLLTRPGLNPYHARIVAFRAIETGTSIFHHCLAGTTIAVDYVGNVLSQSDYFSKNGNGKSCVPLDPEQRCEAPNSVANLPLKGVVTVYAVVGDSGAYLCIAVSIFLILAMGKPKGKVEGKKNK